MKPQLYESKTAPVSKRYEADNVSKKDITILRLKRNSSRKEKRRITFRDLEIGDELTFPKGRSKIKRISCMWSYFPLSKKGFEEFMEIRTKDDQRIFVDPAKNVPLHFKFKKKDER